MSVICCSKDAPANDGHSRLAAHLTVLKAIHDIHLTWKQLSALHAKIDAAAGLLPFTLLDTKYCSFDRASQETLVCDMQASAGPRSGVLLPGQDHSSGTKAADLQQDKASAPESAKPATPTPPVATKSIADALPDSRTEPPTSGAAEASASEVPDLSAHSEPSAEKADSVSASQPAEHAATEALPEAGATAELPEAPATAEPEDSQAVDDVVPDVKEKLQAAHEGETVPPATEVHSTASMLLACLPIHLT